MTLKNVLVALTFAFAVSACGGASTGNEANSTASNSTTLTPATPGKITLPIKNSTFNPGATSALSDWEGHEHNSGKSYTFTSETVDAYSAPSSAKISRYGTEVYGRLDQKMLVDPAWRNKSVRLTGFLKTSGADGTGAGLVLQALTGGGSIIVWDHMDSQRVQGTQPWKSYSVGVKIPQDAYFLLVGVMLEGGGTLWADDFTLELTD